MEAHVKNHRIKKDTDIRLRSSTAYKNIQTLPKGSYVKMISKKYLPRDFDIPYLTHEVVVYTHLGIGVIHRSAIEEE